MKMLDYSCIGSRPTVLFHAAIVYEKHKKFKLNKVTLDSSKIFISQATTRIKIKLL